MIQRPHHLVALPSLAVVSGVVVKRLLAGKPAAGTVGNDDWLAANWLADVWIGLSLALLILAMVRIAWCAFRDGSAPPQEDARDS